MKRSLFALAMACFALTPLSVFSQYNFPLGELQKMAQKNASDFETFVMEKDYSLQSKSSNKELKVFASDKPGPSGKQYIISRYQVPNAMARITFITTDKKHYLDVKAKLAAGGVKYVNEENKTIDGTQAACYNYASGALKVTLCTYTTDVTWFKVELHF
jgi:hypothetical protein